MSIYSNQNYRKIYEEYYGPIPCEPNGRTYEIHHIDGNHSNNNPLNLVAVTLQEHYDIHYAQGDYSSCLLMAKQRMSKTPAELSELGRLNALSQIEQGIHPWQDGSKATARNNKWVAEGIHPFQTRDDGTNLQDDRIANGTHNLVGDKHWIHDPKRKEEQSAAVSAYNNKRVSNGTHPFLGGEIQSKSNAARVKSKTHNLLGADSNMSRLANGTHPSQIKVSCLKCRGISSIANYTKHHLKKC
jgi:hypothetical protein